MTEKNQVRVKKADANPLPDPDYIAKLGEVMAQNGIFEFEWESETQRLVLSRNQASIASIQQSIPAVGTAVMANSQAPIAAHIADDKPAETTSNHNNAFPSPMVGTAYLSPKPNEPKFVKLGDSVEKGQTILIIEAMKVMNQIQAEKSGKLSAILVEDGEPVEYAQPLFIIE